MSHTKYTVIQNITECNTYPNLERISRNWLTRNNVRVIYANNETLMNLHNFTISNRCKPYIEPNKKSFEKVLQFLEIVCKLDTG